MSHQIKRLSKLNPKKTLFLLCDVQDKFRPVMPLFDNMLKNASKLLQAGKALDVPLIATEHYSEKLGKTVKELDISHATEIIEKTKFSMMVPQVESKINELKPNDVVLFGLEGEKGLMVYIVADCSCSRLNQDRDLALERLRQLGCIITTSESVIFSLMQDKNHPKFDIVRKYVNAVSADMELSKTVPAKL